MPIHLVPTPIPNDMLAAAEDIMDGVKAGEIIGLGVVVVLRRRRIFADAFGEVARDPLSARGWIRSLDDCLRELSQRHKNSATTQ